MQIRVKCNEDDTVGDLKKLVAAQTGMAVFCILKVSRPCLLTGSYLLQERDRRRLEFKSGILSSRTISLSLTMRSMTAWAWNCTTIEM